MSLTPEALSSLTGKLEIKAKKQQEKRENVKQKAKEQREEEREKKNEEEIRRAKEEKRTPRLSRTPVRTPSVTPPYTRSPSTKASSSTSSPPVKHEYRYEEPMQVRDAFAEDKEAVLALYKKEWPDRYENWCKGAEAYFAKIRRKEKREQEKEKEKKKKEKEKERDYNDGDYIDRTKADVFILTAFKVREPHLEREVMGFAESAWMTPQNCQVAMSVPLSKTTRKIIQEWIETRVLYLRNIIASTESRGEGARVGAELLAETMLVARHDAKFNTEHPGPKQILLNAVEEAEGFYLRCGFKIASPEFCHAFIALTGESVTHVMKVYAQAVLDSTSLDKDDIRRLSDKSNKQEPSAIEMFKARLCAYKTPAARTPADLNAASKFEHQICLTAFDGSRRVGFLYADVRNTEEDAKPLMSGSILQSIKAFQPQRPKYYCIYQLVVPKERDQKEFAHYLVKEFLDRVQTHATTDNRVPKEVWVASPTDLSWVYNDKSFGFDFKQYIFVPESSTATSVRAEDGPSSAKGKGRAVEQKTSRRAVFTVTVMPN